MVVASRSGECNREHFQFRFVKSQRHEGVCRVGYSGGENSKLGGKKRVSAVKVHLRMLRGSGSYLLVLMAGASPRC